MRNYFSVLLIASVGQAMFLKAETDAAAEACGL